MVERTYEATFVTDPALDREMTEAGTVLDELEAIAQLDLLEDDLTQSDVTTFSAA